MIKTRLISVLEIGIDDLLYRYLLRVNVAGDALIEETDVVMDVVEHYRFTLDDSLTSFTGLTNSIHGQLHAALENNGENPDEVLHMVDLAGIGTAFVEQLGLNPDKYDLGFIGKLIYVRDVKPDFVFEFQGK